MPEYFCGLDLGQQSDHSVLVVLEHDFIDDPNCTGAKVNRWDVRHLHRWHLGTSYPSVVSDLVELFNLSPINDSPLVVDATGVGRAVVDIIRNSGIRASVRPYTITAGREEGSETVPKKDIIAAVVAALQTRRLRFARELELLPVLERELENYRVKVTQSRNEVFEAMRDSDHDDCVAALALCVWYGERNTGWIPPMRKPVPRNPFGPETSKIWNGF